MVQRSKKDVHEFDEGWMRRPAPPCCPESPDQSNSSSVAVDVVRMQMSEQS